jgi:hypothetical protein
VTAKDIGRRGKSIWRIEAETYLEQSSYQLKVLVLQRLRLVELQGRQLRRATMQSRLGAVEYRIGYYIVSATGKWWWGQFAPFVPHADFYELIDLARQEGTLLSRAGAR